MGMMMLSEILNKHFEEAKLLTWQARGIEGYVHSRKDDLRVICFEEMASTIDLLPERLSDQTKPFQAISLAWFDLEVRSLCERVGCDFFPETAAEFVWRLLGTISVSLPDHSRLQQIERWHAEREKDDLAFCDPDPPMCENGAV